MKSDLKTVSNTLDEYTTLVETKEINTKLDSLSRMVSTSFYVKSEADIALSESMRKTLNVLNNL